MDDVDKLGEDVRALEVLALILTPRFALYVFAKWSRYAIEKAAFIPLVGFGIVFLMVTIPQTGSDAMGRPIRDLAYSGGNSVCYMWERGICR